MQARATFDSQRDLIYLTAKVYGPFGWANANLALDTGAAFCILRSDLLFAIGYHVDVMLPSAVIITASREEPVKILMVEKIQAIDQLVENLQVICHDLPESSGVDGVLGLNFLRQFDTEIRYSDSTLTLSPIPF